MKHRRSFSVVAALMTAALAAGAAMAAPADGPRAEARRAPRADLALSASFLPPRFIVENPGRRERVRALLQARVAAARAAGDSAADFSLDHDVLKLSPELLERLAAEDDGPEDLRKPAARPERAGHLRSRARARLEKLAGPGIEEDAPAYPASYVPDDIALRPQWALQNSGGEGAIAGMDLNMARVWDRLDGADTLVIAVLDAGISFLHPELKDRWFVNAAEANGLPGVDDDGNGFIDDSTGWDFVDGDNDPHDTHSHGTQTSGLIAAGFDNGNGIAGMLPRVRILPVRVLSTAGFGTTLNIANGVRYAAAMGAHVINFSIGVGSPPQSTSCQSQTLCSAFLAARDSGAIIAAAAANDGIDLDAEPAQPSSFKLDNVYMIASHTNTGSLSNFSNYGATTVDIAAPGQNVMTTSTPPHLPVFTENFEAFAAARWSFSNGAFEVAADTLEGAKSLRWTSGGSAIAQVDTLDLRNGRGGLLTFRATYVRAGAGDLLRVEIQPFGSGTWTTLATINGNLAGQTLAYNLGAVDGRLFRLRFRLSATGSTASRVLRLDDVRVTRADMNPANQEHYVATSGTSLAAPFFAGYAGLMRVAASRAGVPLTRERMLAGATPVPALAGKVITGGRLDAAKGLDFYLRTVPRLLVTDSASTAWNPGATVGYSLQVVDSAGPRGDYTIGLVAAPPGGTLSPEGVFAWNSGGAANGSYALRAKAVKGDVTLRALATFTLGVPANVAAAPPGAASRLVIGGRAFLLPAGAFDRDRHALRVEVYGADGRTLRTVTGTLVMPARHDGRGRVAEYSLEGAPGVGVRAWLNGGALRPAPRD